MNHLILTLAILFNPLPSPQERMYVVNGGALLTVDPGSGEWLTLTPLGASGMAGLLFENWRLYSIVQSIEIERDWLMEIHPASATGIEVGKTGKSQADGAYSVVRDPTTGLHYVSAGQFLYQLNLETGVIRYITRVEPKTAIINAVAVNSKGEAYAATSASIYHANPALFRIDLDTGELDWVGDFPLFTVDFTALAFDANDTLWGSGAGYLSFIDHRMYTIDVKTLELTSPWPFPMPFGARGIAFGPAPEVESFCEAKTSSAGCAPAIGWSGYPSATAHLGFDVNCAGVVNQSPGFLMLGLGGRANDPFEGGTLCVAAPILRTTPTTSGGSPAGTLDCTGSWRLDVNTWLFVNHPMAPGESFTCQWWGRDPGLTGPASSQLSDALEALLFP